MSEIELIPLNGSATVILKEIGGVCCLLLEKLELSSEPMLRDVKTLTQKAPTSVSKRCISCVVVCEKSEVTSVEEGHDVTRH